MLINSLTVNGFKSLGREEQTIELGRVNCFIGANGVGKSNVLEALGVLGAAAFGTVDNESLMRRGVRAGVPKLYKSSFSSERTPPHIGLAASIHDCASYQVSLLNPIDNPKPLWNYKTELLSERKEIIISRSVKSSKILENRENGLAALKMVELEKGSNAFSLLKMLQNYSIYCPNTPSLRGIIPDQQSRSPLGLSGGLLAEGFESLKKYLESDEDKEVILESILELIDWSLDINTIDNPGGLLSSQIPRMQNVLRFEDKFMNKSRNALTAYDASEGSLYILFAAILCLHPDSPKIFSIDNLDQALNPILLRKLVSNLHSWLLISDHQLLFTAHNPAVLDGLDLTNDEIRLFAVERNSNGVTKIRRININEKLRNLNEKYPLSRLWLKGDLGAVPNV